MKILLLNWRDIKNPLSGGAEILTHEITKRWAALGHEVTIFTSSYPNASKKDIIDGVTIIRAGSPDLRSLFNSVHYHAYKYYKQNYKNNIDVVIDEIHGIPFLTPLYVKEPVIGLICEVANNIWDKMFPFPWNKIGKVAEKLSLFFYKNKHFLTISNSTKDDLCVLGIPEKSITVLSMGINRVKLSGIPKEKKPTAIFVARINKMKGIEDAVQAFKYVVEKIPKAKLWVVGRGDKVYLDLINAKVKEYNLQNNIYFWDFVTQNKKFELMARAHILIVPSIREGFGLTVPEAGSVGTPAIAYNVPGLKEIVDNKNGVLLKNNSPKELAENIILLFNDKKIYNRVRIGAILKSKRYNWDKTAKESLNILLKYN